MVPTVDQQDKGTHTSHRLGILSAPNILLSPFAGSMRSISGSKLRTTSTMQNPCLFKVKSVSDVFCIFQVLLRYRCGGRLSHFVCNSTLDYESQYCDTSWAQAFTLMKESLGSMADVITPRPFDRPK